MIETAYPEGSETGTTLVQAFPAWAKLVHPTGNMVSFFVYVLTIP